MQGGVRVVDANGEEAMIPADSVILATGRRANRWLADALESEGYMVHTIGDANGIARSSRHVTGASKIRYPLSWAR